jgi:dienelactone hydrolase
MTAIGYCFGGGAVLELARSGADIAGVVAFHGSLANPNPADAMNIKARVLVLHGADDPFVDQKQVNAFIEEMRKTKVDWQIDIYGGAVHSFTVPGAGNDPSTGAAPP